jgi:hypothetical protein
MAVADENDYYCFSTLICCVNIGDVTHVNRSGIPDRTEYSDKYRDIYYPLAIVNSSLLEWFYNVNLSDELSVVPEHVNELPIAEIETIDSQPQPDELESLQEEAMEVIHGADSSGVLTRCSQTFSQGNDRLVHDLLAELARKMAEFNRSYVGLNLSLLDYLGSYSEGESLSNYDYQPPSGLANSILTETSETRDGLRVGEAKVDRNMDNVHIALTARYKPEDEDAHETDRWGYTETEPMPAMELTDLTETEADLVEHFVPVAAEEGDGFAGFRENATKTNSLVDRLEAITLPDPDDVADDLERYREAVERAAELDEKIRRTDDLIDDIVYDLYGLTDEEIEIVEEAVADD